MGVQTFSEIRQQHLNYVDKTHFACQRFRQGKHHFLTRPRRFGKSSFVSTPKALFEGRHDLFQGLAADDQWNWSVRRRVVVSVDEYDKPITQTLDAPDLARANRDNLRALYANIKECDEHIRFSSLTGVSKFSKVSLFSSLNILYDLTLGPRYSSLCGYTDHRPDTFFAPELPGLDRDRIRECYNGYSWGGDEHLCHPQDVLLHFDQRDFPAWWFETGTPSSPSLKSLSAAACRPPASTDCTPPTNSGRPLTWAPFPPRPCCSSRLPHHPALRTQGRPLPPPAGGLRPAAP